MFARRRAIHLLVGPMLVSQTGELMAQEYGSALRSLLTIRKALHYSDVHLDRMDAWTDGSNRTAASAFGDIGFERKH